MAGATSAGGGQPAAEPRFLPPGTNSITTSHYLARILQEMTKCVNDVGGTEMSSEAGAGLKKLLETARWKFEDVLGFTWLRGNVTPLAVAVR